MPYKISIQYFLLARTENSVWISLSVGTHRTEMIQINIGGKKNSQSDIWHNTKYKPYQSPEVPVITENTPGIVDKDSWETFWVESELTHNGHLYVAVGKSGEDSFLSTNISDWSGKMWTHVGLGKNPAPVAYRGLYDGQEPVCPGKSNIRHEDFRSFVRMCVCNAQGTPTGF